MRDTARFYRAFTVIELLVAMVVLALMLGFLLQMVNMASSAMSSSSKKLDGLSDSRFALDRMGIDLAARIDRKEFPPLFEKRAGNDSLVFFSEVDGYSPDLKISAVGYRIDSDPDQSLTLQRGVLGKSWDDSLPLTTPASGDLEFEIVAEGVLRLEFAYVSKSGEFIFDRSLTDLSDVSAIVVAIAVIDPESRKMLTNTQINEISGLLADPPSANGHDLISDWEAQLRGSGLPPRAIQAVRFFQRYYHVR